MSHILDEFERALNSSQRRLFAGLTTPERIQGFLDDITYFDDDTYHCPLSVMRNGTGCCFEGALLAAAAFRKLSMPSLLLDMTGERDDDHVLAVYRRKGLWGSVTKSHFLGLRSRKPVYRTLRELVMSYFEFYFNDDGEHSLFRYSVPVDLARFDRLLWMSRDDVLERIASHLDDARHYSLFPSSVLRKLPRVDRLTFRTGKVRAGNAR